MHCQPQCASPIFLFYAFDMQTPEELARVQIDRKLLDAGWNVIDRNEFTDDMSAVAIRETAMTHGMEADYILFINGRAAGVIEAKREEVALDNKNLIAQVENYGKTLHPRYRYWEKPLKLLYVSNGKAIAFKDNHKKDATFEIIKGFHTPKKMAALLGIKDPYAGLPYLDPKGLRDCQFKAINGLERMLRDGKTRVLLPMATGSGKTYTAATIAYRLLEYTQKFKRVLFLVDRNNLGAAAKAEFDGYTRTQSHQPFSQIFNVDRISNKPLEPRTSVVISTIQGLYAQLSDTFEEIQSEQDSFARGNRGGNVDLPEHPTLSKDFFDLIIIDECHRSIYSEWRKVLDYFDTAVLVGLTATPIPETLAFFDKNIPCEYTLEDSIVDGVNVGHRIYRIRTELTENGGEIQAGDKLKVRYRNDGHLEEKKARSDREFSGRELNRSIIVKDQIRKVIEEYKSVVYTKMYPEREPNFDYLPKTLIFAASDAHADNVVEVVNEVFGRTDKEFAQKITYSAGDSNALIREFRTSPRFRVAVTVTLVATGTDIKPLEVLIFLNDVRSETLYVQMKGRGVRTVSDDQLRSVTPNAHAKELFYLVDAVGVTESEKVVPSPTDKETVLNPSLEKLLEELSHGHVQDENLQLLAGKLSTIANRADQDDIDDFTALAEFELRDFAAKIFKTLDEKTLPPFVSANEPNTQRRDLIADLMRNIPARKKLIEIAKGYVKEIVGKQDVIIESGFSTEEAQSSTAAFEAYVNKHKDEIEALRLIYNHESDKVSYEMLTGLEKKLRAHVAGFSVAQQWRNYGLLKPTKVRALTQATLEVMTNLIQLVRMAYGHTDQLVCLTSRAASQFELWCGQKQRVMPMSADEKALFKKIASYIATNGMYTFKTLRMIDPDAATALLRLFKNAKAANEPLISLNEFILEAA